MASTPPPRLLRAAALGLGCGLLIAGLVLIGVGLRARFASNAPCPEDEVASECVFQRETALELSKLQLFGGLGLGLLAIATFLSVRAQDRKDAARETLH